MLDEPPLASDILKGVRNIALFLYGSSDKSAVRSVYHIVETSNTIPTFKLAGFTCARKSSIRAKIWLHEARAWEAGKQEELVRLHILLTSILRHVSTTDSDGHAGSGSDQAHLWPLVAEAARTIQRALKVETP
jgi:hypothetical protein